MSDELRDELSVAMRKETAMDGFELDKKSMGASHWNAAQMERLLAGKPDAAMVAHMERCAPCREEAAAMQAVFGDLRASLTSAAMRQRRMAAPAAGERKIAQGKRWMNLGWAGALAVLTLGVGLPLTMHRGGPVVAPQTIATNVGPTGSTAPAMSDDALLNGVQSDLATTVPAPLAPLESPQTESK